MLRTQSLVRNALLALFALNLSLALAWAQKQTVLFSFNGTDGANPAAGLVLDNEGNLYGTTALGGANDSGTVFKVSPSGNLTVLHTFCNASGCPDGSYPNGGLTFDAKGNLYGATSAGGTDDWGAVFKLTQTGKEVVIRSFDGLDGESPHGSLVFDARGNLYGTTLEGGGADSGVLFKIGPRGGETVLSDFAYGTNGAEPYAGVVIDDEGNLYGTTLYGGKAGGGVVFKVTSTGEQSVLYNFCTLSNCADGEKPYAGLILDQNGNVYGTTSRGGAYGYGTVFEVNSTGQEAVLYSFCQLIYCTDGSYPQASLVFDKDGRLYGTTSSGGAYGRGTVFKVTAAGEETVLHNFCPRAGCSDGRGPVAGLVFDQKGNLYGTTPSGGAYSTDCNGEGCGTVFKITP
jgi:uncharacterized repeat protein (TIGR03803 family)